jgi:hypothetical protein
LSARIVAVFVLFGFVAAFQALPVAAQTPDIAAVYRQFIDAINRGNVTAALALTTDDVQLQGTPGCIASPCRGRAAVRQDLEQDVAGHLQIQSLGSIQVSTNTVKANTAHRADVLRGTGVSRVIINETLTFQGDKIARVVFDPDASDPQSATILRLLTGGPPPSAPAAAAVQPAPAAAQPAAPPPITPPSTGDAGLRATLE